MGGVLFPPCWLFGLRHPSNGAYMVVGLGSGHRVKIAAFKRAHTEYSSVPLPPVSLTSQWATATHHIPRRHPPTPACRSDSGSYEVTAFSLSPSVHRLCVLQERDFHFLPSCGFLTIKPRWPSVPNALGAPPPNAKSSYWGPYVKLRTINSCGITSAI